MLTGPLSFLGRTRKSVFQDFMQLSGATMASASERPKILVQMLTGPLSFLGRTRKSCSRFHAPCGRCAAVPSSPDRPPVLGSAAPIFVARIPAAPTVGLFQHSLTAALYRLVAHGAAAAGGGVTRATWSFLVRDRWSDRGRRRVSSRRRPKGPSDALKWQKGRGNTAATLKRTGWLSTAETQPFCGAGRHRPTAGRAFILQLHWESQGAVGEVKTNQQRILDALENIEVALGHHVHDDGTVRVSLPSNPR